MGFINLLETAANLVNGWIPIHRDGQAKPEKVTAAMIIGEGAASLVGKGLLASRPSAGVVGRLYFVTDSSNERWTRDTGSAWEDVGPDWDFVTGKPPTFTPATHGTSAHSGNILPSASDQVLGAGTLAISERAAPSDPASGTRGIYVDSTTHELSVRTSAGSTLSLEKQGEANTASNVGTAGEGVFDGKVGADLRFRKLNAASGKLTIALDSGNQKIDLDVVDASTSQKGAVQLAAATGGVTTAGLAVQASDARLSDARTPTSHTHPASDIASGTIATARLGSGTTNSGTFLRGDQTWAAPAATTIVKEVDGSPSVAASTVEFDQAKGLTVTDQGSGVARVSIGDASTTDKGVAKLAVDDGTVSTAGLVLQASDARIAQLTVEPWEVVDDFDHFVGNIASRWVSGGGIIQLPSGGESGRPGIGRLQAPALSFNSAIRSDDDGSLCPFIPNDIARVVFMLRVDVITDLELQLGLADAEPDGANAILFRYNQTALGSSSWQFRCTSGGTSTNSASLYTWGDLSWVKLELRRSATSTWQFWVQDSLYATTSTHVPSAALRPFVYVESLHASQTREIHLDYYRLRTRLLP